MSKPTGCVGCPLETRGGDFTVPSPGTNGVLLLGDMPSNERASFKLFRMIEWAGFRREDFTIASVVMCEPPEKKLEGAWFAQDATSHCRRNHWDHLLAAHRVVVPLGDAALRAVSGADGILSKRGYPSHVEGGITIVPTLPPSYVQRGQSKWTAAVINDIQKAVRIAQEGYQPVFKSYHLDPSPLEALRWAEEFERESQSGRVRYMAFDIETPGKGENEDELDEEGKDQTWHIERIGFSYRAHSALSIPFEPLYFAAIRKILSSTIPKVVWNAGFDVPRLRRAGFPIAGQIHDGMVAWHILHSDLPKRLAFVATFTCPEQTAWKHLSGSKPAFYNATDADVELRSMEVIEDELRKTQLWEVYQRDVLDLEPVLHYMQEAGMPLDMQVREKAAVQIAAEAARVMGEMEAQIPLEARRIAHVYKTTPKDPAGLHSRPGIHAVPVCPHCGIVKPPRSHFKVFKKKVNPCGGGSPQMSRVEVEEFYRLADFTPSRDQLIRLHQHLKRPIPMVLDKKTRQRKPSFGEKQLRELMIKYPGDPLYGLILSYRALDKLAGTYIGRPVE